MKILQSWIRETPWHTIAQDVDAPVLCVAYEKLCKYRDAAVNEDRILFICQPAIPVSSKIRPWVKIYSVSERDEVIPGVSYIPWGELLGYQVSDKSVEQYGVGQVISHILHGMTTFGLDESAVAEARNELDDCYEKVKDVDNLEDFMTALDMSREERQVYMMLMGVMSPDPKDKVIHLSALRADLGADPGRDTQ